MNRPTKITFDEMRDMGVRGVVIYCQDYKCSHSLALSAEPFSRNLNQKQNLPAHDAGWHVSSADLRPPSHQFSVAFLHFNGGRR
jgi:hypothetical protein